MVTLIKTQIEARTGTSKLNMISVSMAKTVTHSIDFLPCLNFTVYIFSRLLLQGANFIVSVVNDMQSHV